MTTWDIAQALHGYQRGHRLLASSLALSDEEQRLLEQLSDLSGYLPSGARFTCYHTGFPCGRFYAFAATWPDRHAERAGTVITHSLLLPLAALTQSDQHPGGAVSDLFTLAALHHCPAPLEPLDRYQAPLPCPPGAAPTTDPPLALRRGALALLFGQSDLPLLWLDAEPPRAVVAFLWRALWPAARAGFSFCTLALQPRSVRGAPFTFLGLPPSAQGAFHELRRSTAWWDGEGPRSPEVRASLESPWLDALLAAGTAELLERSRAEGLRAPNRTEVPLLFRFHSLEARARESLPAASARADLLARYQPDADADPWARVLRDLNRRQGEAPLTPHPLWYLTDLHRRPQTAPWLSRSAALAAAVEQVLIAELTHRCRHAPRACAAELGELYEAIALPQQRLRVTEVVCEWVKASQSLEQATQIAADLIAAQAPAALLTAALTPLPAAARLSVVADVGASDDRLVATALALRDPELLLSLRQRRDELIDGWPEALALLPADAEPERVSALLAQLPPPERLRWALSVADSALAPLAAEHGAAAAVELRLPLQELVAAAALAPGGPGLLLRHASAVSSLALRDALLPQQALALAMVERGLQGGTTQGSRGALEALAALRMEDDLPTQLRTALSTSTGEPALQRKVAEKLGRQLYRLLWLGTITAEQAAEWLAVAALRGFFSQAERWALVPRPPEEQQGPHLRELAEALWQAAIPPVPAEWQRRILLPALTSVGSTELERATPALVQLSALLTEQAELLSALLGAVQRHPTASGHLVVAQVFPGVYQQMLANRVPAWSWFLPHGYRWDHGKALRHWLLDTFLEMRWPAISFLRAVGGAELRGGLLAQLCKRAAGSTAGRAFMSTLPEALAADPELAHVGPQVIEILAQHAIS